MDSSCCEQAPEGGATQWTLDALDDREAQLVQALAQDCTTRLGFQGLKRQLDLHPQTLSRILRRLERQGWVEKTPDGYQLARQACTAIQSEPSRAMSKPMRPIVAAVAPAFLTPDRLRDALAHRWFQGLRWYGVQEAPGGVALLWQQEHGGGLIRLRLVNQALSLETDQTTTPQSALEAIPGLLSALASLYAPTANRLGSSASYAEAPRLRAASSDDAAA